MLSDRFILVDQDNAFEVLKVDSGYLALVESMVVDTQAEHGPKTLGSDELEPEDARFTRRLSLVPEVLNQLARELECERAEVRSLSDANAKLLAEIECWRVGARDLSNVIKTGSEANKKQHEEIVKLRAEVERWKREFDLCPRY